LAQNFLFLGQPQIGKTKIKHPKTMPKPRIDIPTAPKELINLASAIKEQHDTLAKSSPLTLLEWEKTGPQIDEAAKVQEQIDKLGKQIEKLIQRRNNFVDPLGDFVRSSKDILSGVYRAEMRKLGDFGFEVDDTPKAKKSKPDPAAK